MKKADIITKINTLIADHDLNFDAFPQGRKAAPGAQ